MAGPSLILFGGTFDPPHAAHAAVVDAVLARRAPDRVLLVPAVRPVTAGGGEKEPATPYATRVRLLSLAFAPALAAGRVAVSRVEEGIAPPIYTLKTLRAVQAETPDARVGFIMGQDQWAAFDRWHGPREILAIADVHVVRRPGFPPLAAEAERILGLLGLTYAWTGDNTVSLAGGRHVYLYPDVALDVSSTALRAALKAGDPVAAQALAPPVRDAIMAEGLYGTRRHP